jgi:hypothetical protein
MSHVINGKFETAKKYFTSKKESLKYWQGIVENYFH